MRVPHAVSMSDCVVACCDLSDCDLSWMFERHCFIVSCQHKGNCEPKKMDRVKSYLTFVLRPLQRPSALIGYGQMPSNVIRSMALQADTSEEVNNLEELSFLSKERSQEEEPDYPDGYEDMEQKSLPLSIKHEEKENVNYADWGSIGTTENGLNASGLSNEGNHKELTGSEDEKGDLVSATNKKESEVNCVTKCPGELQEVTLNSTEKTTSEFDFQPPKEVDGTWQEEVLTPSHNPPPPDKLGFLSTATVQTSGLGNLIQRGTTALVTSTGPTKPSDQVLFVPAATKAVKELLVSAGDNLQLTLPKNDIELHASVVTPLLSETAYNYEWSLLSCPEDYNGEMEDRYSQTLKLSHLPEGTYAFKVMVSTDNAYGEGLVNVTVQPAIKTNQPPVAIVSPIAQEILFPTTSALIDGNQSIDDTKIVSYHWEEIEGPMREEKVSSDTPVLHLSNLVPGYYTFRLTVIDSEGAANSTTASLRVSKPVDYPPVAYAGPSQTINLPQSSIILNGNQSNDDHAVVRYEWSLSPQSQSKVVEMQGVRSPYLQLSAMQEGNYTFQLTVTDSAAQQSTAEVTVIVQPEKNSSSAAVADPDKDMFPVQSTILHGSKNTDDGGGTAYNHWENISRPSSLEAENVDGAVTAVTGLELGIDHFRPTARDNQELSSATMLPVTVKAESNHPPQANAGGKHILVLPNNSIALDGSQSSDDQEIVSYLWIRDGQSPAAGDVLHGSDHEAILQLTNLVEGIYTFHLKVIDGSGDSDINSTTVEVRPDPKKNGLVELILQVGVGHLSEQQKDTLVRQLAVLLNVLDSDIKVQKIHAYSDISTAVVFYVQSGHPFTVLKASDVAQVLRSQLLKEKPDFLLFKVLRVDTAACLLTCSGHGHCDPITKRCICYQLWMENLIQQYLTDGESNCDWSVFYVIVSAFILVVLMVGLAWLCIGCCKSRKRTKTRKKTKYTILDNIDDQERMELRPKYGIKHRSTEHNSSLMVSESEFDSDQDTIFSREKSERENSRNARNGSIKNGISFSYSSTDR
ncbi:dyslexia-associated protein KIAA0319 homolog [Tiliqua scincoides]|uniref:dyslexia-associated protein KIAA0319 homolog n=1 Tax=Tiliqua scincoides TaxID=71010 RepID=UPI0034630451